MGRRRSKTTYWQDAPMPRNQLVLIPDSLEDTIPEDHPVRLIDELLDRLDWSSWEAKYHGSSGRPPIHPSVMAKVLLFAMTRRLRSSRVIEYELKHSVDFMWLSSGRQIDHTTLCIFRKTHSAELRDIFRQMVKLGIKLGIAKLSELCIDGTRVLANASKRKSWTADRLKQAIEQLDQQFVEALASLDANDTAENDLLGEGDSADQLPAQIADLQARRDQLETHFATAQQMDINRKRFGTKGPGQIPKTDPDSRILPSKEGGYAPNYTPMVATDSTGGLIVSANVVIGNVEHDQLGSILDTVEEDFEVTIEQCLADAAYTSGENLKEAEERGVNLIGPLSEKKYPDNPAERADPTQPVAPEDLDKLPIRPQTKRFDKAAFVYDEQDNVFYCPAGKRLEHSKTERTCRQDGKLLLRDVYTSTSCADCSIAAMCRQDPNAAGGRRIVSDQHEAQRRRHRKKMERSEAQEAYLRRTHAGEYPFAVIKHMFGMRRFLLRGIDGVRQEWLWAATAFNAMKLTKAIASMRAEVTIQAE